MVAKLGKEFSEILNNIPHLHKTSIKIAVDNSVVWPQNMEQKQTQPFHLENS